MKRHPDLLQLSREHYGALKLARDARRAAGSGEPNAVATLAQRVVEVFAAELDPHFRVEEQGILLLLAQAGQDELAARTLVDHAELRRLAKALATPDADTLLRFPSRRAGRKARGSLPPARGGIRQRLKVGAGAAAAQAVTAMFVTRTSARSPNASTEASCAWSSASASLAPFVDDGG